MSFGADPVVSESPGDERSLLSAIIGDGRPLLLAVAASLVFAGGFVIFLAVTRQLLPHDLAYLDMTSRNWIASPMVAWSTSWSTTGCRGVRP